MLPAKFIAAIASALLCCAPACAQANGALQVYGRVVPSVLLVVTTADGVELSQGGPEASLILNLSLPATQESLAFSTRVLAANQPAPAGFKLYARLRHSFAGRVRLDGIDLREGQDTLINERAPYRETSSHALNVDFTDLGVPGISIVLTARPI